MFQPQLRVVRVDKNKNMCFGLLSQIYSPLESDSTYTIGKTGNHESCAEYI